MTILFAANTPADFLQADDDHGLFYSTDTESRDANYVPHDIGFTAYEYAATPFGMEFSSPSTDFWLHFRVYIPGVSSSGARNDFYLLALYDASDNMIARIRGFDADFYAQAIADTTVTGASMPTGANRTWILDLHVVVNGTTDITVDMYLNGARVSSATAANTGGLGGVSRVLFENNNVANVAGGGTSDTMHYSEIVCLDGESPRGWRLSELFPASAGDHTDFDGDYTELGDENLASAAAGGANGDRVSSNLSTYNGPASSSAIRAVVSKAVAAKGTTGPGTLVQSLRIGATDYDGSSVALSTDYASLMEVWDNNPATASGWATSDFAGTQIGLKAET